MSADTSIVPSVLSEELTEAEQQDLDNVLVTDFEKRHKIFDAERNERRAAAAASSPANERAAPIGSSETKAPKISPELMKLIPGLSPKVAEDPASESKLAKTRGFLDVPDLLEDIRESVARIQDRSFLEDQKPEYPPRAPPVQPVVEPGELCSRKYGFCRTIPMILTDIAFHLRAISTVPSRQRLKKDAEESEPGVSPFQKSLAPPAYADPRPPFAQRPSPSYGQRPQKPPFAPRGRGAQTPVGPDPDAPLPKPNSDAPPQVDADNTNEDTGDGLGDAIAEENTKGGGDFEDLETAYGGDIADADLDDEDDAPGQTPPGEDGYYKIVTINHPEPM